MIGETRIKGHVCVLTQEPGSAMSCDITLKAFDREYTGSLTRLESLDGRLESEDGRAWFPSDETITEIGNWAREHGY